MVEPVKPPAETSTEIEGLRSKLQQYGVPEDMLKTFSAQDVVTMAAQFGLMEKK